MKPYAVPTGDLESAICPVFHRFHSWSLILFTSLRALSMASTSMLSGTMNRGEAVAHLLRFIFLIRLLPSQAIKALRKYYDKLEERMDGYEFLQTKEDPQAPETFGNYEGQSGKGGDAIQMLEFILDETKKEETVEVPEEIQELAKERWEAKIAKDWSLADQLRSELTDKGWQIKDGKDGFELAKLAE